jgi:hypothetical protein
MPNNDNAMPKLTDMHLREIVYVVAVDGLGMTFWPTWVFERAIDKLRSQLTIIAKRGAAND